MVLWTNYREKTFELNFFISFMLEYKSKIYYMYGIHKSK